MKKVTVYTTTPCPYCQAAKNLLQSKGIAFEEIEYGWDEKEKWVELATRSGMKTMPQIFIDEECIGGYSELSQLSNSGELDKKLR